MKSTYQTKTDENYLLCSRVLKGLIFLVKLTKLCFIPSFVIRFLFGVRHSQRNPAPVEVSDIPVTALNEAEFHPSFFRLPATKKKVLLRGAVMPQR